MSGSRAPMIPGGGAGPVSAMTAAEVAGEVVSLVRSLSAEHTRRKAIEAQCRVLVVQLEAQARENRIALKNQFRQRGITLEALLGMLKDVVERETASSASFDMLLQAVLRVLEYDPLLSVRRSSSRVELPASGPFSLLDEPAEEDS